MRHEFIRATFINIALAFSMLLPLCNHPTKVAGGSTTTDNARVTGSVFYADGAPARGAAVRVRPNNYLRLPGAEPDSIVRHDTTVDDSGKFIIDSLKMGAYRIEINDQKADALLLACSIVTDKDVVVLPGDTLRPYTAIDGKVDSTHLGKTPLFVQIVGLDRIVSVDTATGGFTISGLPPGNYTVRIVSVDTNVIPVVIDSVVTDTGVTFVSIDTLNSDTSGIDTTRVDTTHIDTIPPPVFGLWNRVDGPFVTNFDCATADAHGTIFTGSQRNIVYYSTDRGATWSVTINGLSRMDITCLAKASKGDDNSPQVYAGAGSGGICRAVSTEVWTSLTAGSTTVNNTGIRALAVSKDGALIFAGTAYKGMLKSVDKGSTWSVIDKGNGFPDSTVYSIALFQNTAGVVTVFAGTPQNGVLRSIDTGTTWTNSGNGLPDFPAECIVPVPGGKKIFLGNRSGIYVSIDNGVTWTQALAQTASGSSVPSVSMAVSGANVYAALNNTGVFRSGDSGSTWTSVNAGLPTFSVGALAISGDKVIACPENYGVFSAAIGGTSWTSANTGVSYEPVFQITSGGADLFASTVEGIFRSVDDGANWAKIWDKMSSYNFSTFAVSNGISGSVTLFAQSDYKLHSSVDRGATWAAIGGIDRQYSIKTVSAINSTVFAGFEFLNTAPGGTGLETSVVKSSDNGITWSPRNPKTLVYEIRDMVAAPVKTGGESIFMVTTDGLIWRSADNGDNWGVVTAGLPDINVDRVSSITVCIHGNGNTTIIAGTSTSMYRSSDNGESWTEDNTGLPMNSRVTDLCVSQNGSANAYVFASVDGASGVYLSTDNGDTWQAFDNGLPGTSAEVLGIHKNFLFGGGVNGLWRVAIR